MKNVLSALAIGAFVFALDAAAADFARSSKFASVKEFEATVLAFQPAVGKTDLTPLFTVRELGQPEDPQTGTPVTAPKVQSSTTLWANDSQALVFVTASPPIEATQAVVGVLFLLKRDGKSWQIADAQRFSAFGKYAGVSAKLTSGSDTDNGRPNDWTPIVTIEESQGGRGYSYQVSGSYKVHEAKLQRLDLE